MTVTHDADTTDARPSVLGSLLARREQLLQEQVLELKIPRWKNPEIIVRYTPIEYELVQRLGKRIEKAKADKQVEVEIDANADTLIASCAGVFAVIDGVRYSLREGDEDGEPTRFDRDLAENLGLPEGSTARQVVRTMYLTDGDMFQHAAKIMEFSGFAVDRADEELAGES